MNFEAFVEGVVPVRVLLGLGVAGGRHLEKSARHLLQMALERCGPQFQLPGAVDQDLVDALDQFGLAVGRCGGRVHSCQGRPVLGLLQEVQHFVARLEVHVPASGELLVGLFFIQRVARLLRFVLGNDMAPLERFRGRFPGSSRSANWTGRTQGIDPNRQIPVVKQSY